MSEYGGTTIDLEVARYGLRTFRAVPASQVNEDPYNPWRSMMRSFDSTILFGEEKPPESVEPLELCSVAQGGSHWADGTCTAECLPSLGFPAWLLLRPGLTAETTHQAPHENCHCGIYATHTLHHLQQQYGRQADKIVTVIAAEGQTILGDKGFRTQYARVTAYWSQYPDIFQAGTRQFRGANYYSDLNKMLHDYRIPA